MSDEAQSAIELLHCAFKTDSSVESIAEEIEVAKRDPSVENEIAASGHFWEFEGDREAVDASWESYFDELFASATRLMGDPLYSGGWGKEERFNDFSFWYRLLPEGAHAHRLAVWDIGEDKDAVDEDEIETKLYLRIGSEDMEVPYTIGFGIGGCGYEGNVYPGQYDD